MDPGRALLSLKIIAIAALLAARFPAAESQATCSQQPVISTVEPPSGSRQTMFEVYGDNLDAGTISITDAGVELSIPTLNVSASRILFTVEPPESNGPVNFNLDPDDGDCESVSIEIYLVSIGKNIQKYHSSAQKST